MNRACPICRKVVNTADVGFSANAVIKNQMKKEVKIKPPVTSLADLQQMCAKTRRVEFIFEGNPCAFDVRRLTPTEEARLGSIITEIQPPMIKGNIPENDRIDFMSADFMKRKAGAEIQVRAIGLYLCVPEIAAGKPNLTDANQITEYVQGLLTQPILDVLWKGVRDSGVTLAELTNFT